MSLNENDVLPELVRLANQLPLPNVYRCRCFLIRPAQGE